MYSAKFQKKNFFPVLYEAYAPVISRSALEGLESHGIPCEYHRLVPGIRNRTGTGPCPMEAATANITDPKEAPEVLEKTLQALTKG